MEVWCNLLWFWDPWARQKYVMSLYQQWPLSLSVLLDSWSFICRGDEMLVQRYISYHLVTFRLWQCVGSGPSLISLIQHGRGRQIGYLFRIAVYEGLLTASFWITNNRLLMCSIWFSRLVLYITCDHPFWVLFLHCTHS